MIDEKELINRLIDYKNKSERKTEGVVYKKAFTVDQIIKIIEKFEKSNRE